MQALSDERSRKRPCSSRPRSPAAFASRLELSGARPKELAEAVVSDFDGERLRLSHRKGRPPKLRSRCTVDPLTVAAQTGTSLRMIERTYFKFIRSALLEKLAGLKMRPGGPISRARRAFAVDPAHVTYVEYWNSKVDDLIGARPRRTRRARTSRV